MKPRHPRPRRFLNSGIYDDLTSFSELEQRIKQLPGSTERGDAFEVFVEAYLVTHKICQAREVWPSKAYTPELISQFNLGQRPTVGNDGLYKTVTGEWYAYEAKFRSQEHLTWTEISSFFGRTEQFDRRVVISSCNSFAPEIENALNTTIIRGNDLARLKKEDFDAILQWLKGIAVKAVRKHRDNHQVAALGVINPALQKHDRVTAIMACGTGKTLVTLWAAEESGAKSVLVLVPSLALIRQTLHEWLAQTTWPDVAYLCVCSDPSVRRGADNIVLRPSDLDFPVKTDSENVADFLEAPFDGVKLVFSTYKSAKVVAKGMDKDFSFDLAVFDEAHKTAGKERKLSSFALHDTNLAIRKRLFVTATPRHYSPRKRKKGDEPTKLYSMDDPEIYGPMDCRYQLSFAKAARDGIICDYKVIIPVITQEEVTNELLRRGEVLVEGDYVRAQQVANQLSIKQAIEKDGVKKIISFHRLVDSARSFTSKESEGIKSVIPELWAGHVNGEMKTVDREGVMNEFKAAAIGIVSNAGCLTEGVDVPAVDMVAFTSPKRSKIDIVQATGRAMRKIRHDPSKTIGYVFIPLYVERAKGETVEQAIERQGFENLVDVLNAMKDQDEVLVDILREMQEERGRVGGFDDSRFREKLEIRGQSTTQDILRDAITTIVLDQLGTSWDYFFGKLQAYKEEHGDCLVPTTYKDDRAFGYWTSNQRQFYKNGTLWPYRVEKLNSIDFEWDVTEAIWDKRYRELEEYYVENGHSDVPAKYAENPELGNWVSHQRTFRKKRLQGELSQDQIDRLDKLDFSWDYLESLWNKTFRKLANGESVPSHWKEKQRKQYREGTLSEERLKLLISVDFELNPYPDEWSKNLKSLEEYHAKFNSWNVPKKYDKALCAWVSAQRTAKTSKKKINKLSRSRIDRLNEIGFDWRTLIDQKWDENYRKLANGESPPGSWEEKQRARWREGKLSKKRIELLQTLGMEKDELSEAWNTHFEALKGFHSRFDHWNVPMKWDKTLSSWVMWQRKHFRDGKLPQNRIDRLNGIGFDWRAENEQKWDEKFEALEAFKKKYGHCDVPYKFKDDLPLYRWVEGQRQMHRAGKLTVDRWERLEKIGFTFDFD